MGYGIVVSYFISQVQPVTGNFSEKKRVMVLITENHECSKHPRHVYKYLDEKGVAT